MEYTREIAIHQTPPAQTPKEKGPVKKRGKDIGKTGRKANVTEPEIIVAGTTLSIRAGKIFCVLREICKMTQADAGKIMNTSQQAIGNHERGLFKPTLHTIMGMCKVYNFRPLAFFKILLDEKNALTEAEIRPYMTYSK